MLQPTNSFRFMDLPAEIRLIVYSYLCDEGEEYRIMSYNPDGKSPRRPVLWDFRPGTWSTRKGLTWDKNASQWLGQPFSSNMLLAVSKQVQEEAGPFIYGRNRISPDSFSDAQLFLDTIGDMRRFIRAFKVPVNSYDAGLAHSVFKKLQDATNLQEIIVPHSNLCGWRCSLGTLRLAYMLRTLLAASHKRPVTDSEASPRDVLDILHVVHDRNNRTCGYCKSGKEP